MVLNIDFFFINCLTLTDLKFIGPNLVESFFFFLILIYLFYILKK